MIGSNLSSSIATPSVKVINFNIDKKSGSESNNWCLHFDYIIEQNGFRATNQDRSNRLGVTFILGTREGGYLLNYSTTNAVMKQSWKKLIRMDFDLITAETHAGQHNKSVVLRVFHEFVSDLDIEIVILL